MKKTVFFLSVFLVQIASSQEFFNISGNNITLQNGLITKKIRISGDSLYSFLLTDSASSFNFIEKSRDFSFLVNNNPVNGYKGWKLTSVQPISDYHLGNGLKIILEGKSQWNRLRLELNYMMYPGVPVIRKWIGFANNSYDTLKLEALNVEDLQTTLSQVSTQVYNQYGRMKKLGRFIGTWDDPVIVVHDVTGRHGIAVGNEAPGVLKRTAYHTVSNNIETGMTHPGQDFPFCKYLEPGEEWESPKVFLAVYSGCDDGFATINETINFFVTRFMQPRIVQLKQKPVFVYNTWYPFRTFLSDTLVREVAKAAAECGVQEFIIDDGWQVNAGGLTSKLAWGGNYGDWKVDENKFPGGLKATFDYIRSLGMKPGLWISIGSATSDSRVFQDHPEWFVKNRNNRPGNIHYVADSSDFFTSCMGTNWMDYIRDVILGLVNDYGLAYAKLDLSVVTSAYVNDNSISGCYATDHPYHRDHQESFLVIYERVFKLFDELHAAAPDLFIDCTFETAGKLQLMDYAIAHHAEGNWLSNFEEPSPIGPLRVRQMAWWRSPALPAGSLVIGNQSFDDPEFGFMLKSLIGTLPIVLGDPRKVPENKRAEIRKWSQWMQRMQENYDYMSFRKDLPGFGEPREGSWDGWMRINFLEKSGGIFGVFRQGALENSRRIFLQDLQPDKNYVVRSAPDGTVILQTTGHELMIRGFEVRIDNLYDGKIFEIGLDTPRRGGG
jgi:alpha-galactosidase